MQTRDPSIVNCRKGRGREKDLVRSIIGMKFLITAMKDHALVTKGEKRRQPLNTTTDRSPFWCLTRRPFHRRMGPPPALPVSFGPQKPVPTTAHSDSQRGVEQSWALAFLEDVRREINWLFYELPGVTRERDELGRIQKSCPFLRPQEVSSNRAEALYSPFRQKLNLHIWLT